MAFGVTDQLIAKTGAQVIRLGVQQSLNELPAFAFAQINRRLTRAALKLVDDQLQRVALILELRCAGIGPLRCSHKDSAVRQAPAKVKQKIDRTGVCPLEVVQH